MAVESLKGVSLEQLEKALATSTVTVGKAGGRSFTLRIGGENVNVKFKDILNRFEEATNKALKTTEDKDKIKQAVRRIEGELIDLNFEGNVKVAKAPIGIRILTRFKQAFGNFLRPEHSKKLISIHNSVTPKIDESEKKLIKSIMKDFSKNHQKELRELSDLFKDVMITSEDMQESEANKKWEEIENKKDALKESNGGKDIGAIRKKFLNSPEEFRRALLEMADEQPGGVLSLLILSAPEEGDPSSEEQQALGPILLNEILSKIVSTEEAIRLQSRA